MTPNNDLEGFSFFILSLLKKIAQYTVHAIRKNLIVIAVIFLLICSFKISNKYAESSYYKAAMGCYLYTLNYKIYGEMAEGLNTLAANRSYDDLAKSLNISAEQAKNILSITATNTQGIPLKDDFSEDKGPMVFTVISNNKNIYAPLQLGLLNYLKDNPINTKMRDIDTPRMNKKIAYLDQDINITDSIIKTYIVNSRMAYLIKDTGKGNVDIISWLSYKDQLEDKRLQQENRRNDIVRSVEIAYGFAPAKNPFFTMSELFYLLLKTLFISCACGVVVKIITDIFRH